jgi:hypothetical protein
MDSLAISMANFVSSSLYPQVRQKWSANVRHTRLQRQAQASVGFRKGNFIRSDPYRIKLQQQFVMDRMRQEFCKREKTAAEVTSICTA